ncbi:hypothetical protein Fmac_013384 [Flemingia macrophylla]|uniref:DDE Tnp4 domain-containing protein n=1 Tax=Flemingia macrophylla TaxID=520843 RepID=A0ABD1MSY5_9FABA
MTLLSIQLTRWLTQVAVWRLVGFVSTIVGLLCYGLSSSFNHLFGEWTMLKIFIYTIFSLFICLGNLFAMVCRHSTIIRFKAHCSFVVLAITSVYSYFADKLVNGKPDAYSLISCAAFAMMSLSLSRQTQCGFEVDLFYFFMGSLIVLLMKINLALAIVGVGFCYALVILRSSLANSNIGIQDDQVDLTDAVVLGVNHLAQSLVPTNIDATTRDLSESTSAHVDNAIMMQRQLCRGEFFDGVKDRSKDWWEGCNRPDFPESEFRKCFRMSKSTFDTICQHLDSAVTKKNTMLRDAIPVRQRVAVCICRLATGDPLREVSKRFGLGISTCHKLVLEVCSAIKTVLIPEFLRWPDEAGMEKTKVEFEALSGIPNVGGSMHTTHIPIIAPKSNVNAYFNKRHTERNQKTCYSITVQGVVDSEGVFRDVCIGWPGSLSDEQVLEKSALYQRASRGSLKEVWVVGNSGHPLMEGVLVPYTHQNLTWTQHAFNEKVGEIQGVAKEAFARLKGRWSCLQKRTEVKLEDLPALLGACCVLHNICEMMNEEMDPTWKYDIFDDQMVAENGIRSNSAVQARDHIAHYLLHHGRAGTAFS